MRTPTAIIVMLGLVIVAALGATSVALYNRFETSNAKFRRASEQRLAIARATCVTTELMRAILRDADRTSTRPSAHAFYRRQFARIDKAEQAVNCP